MKEFKYLEFLFTREGEMERETDRWIGAMSAEMGTLCWIVEVKSELSLKAKQ